MEAELEQFPAKNPNPVLSVAKDGTVLYSNKAGEPLLKEWGVGVEEKMPVHIRDIVQRVIAWNSQEKMEIKTDNGVFLVLFNPYKECVNIYGFDISDQKELEEKLRTKEKQNDVLHQIGKIALEEESLQAFMDESVKLITSIMNLEYCKIMELLPDGNFLLRAGIGWKPDFVGKNIVRGENGSQAGYTLLLGMPVIVEDFEKENRFEKPCILKIHSIASGASVIIGSAGKIFGVLVVNSTKKRKFTAEDTYFLSSVAFLIAQVIERKKAEEALKKAHSNLEAKVKERTDELQKAYRSLKESEERLAEAQKLAHVGSYDWDIATDTEFWSEELFRIFGLNPQAQIDHNIFLEYIHPEDLDHVNSTINKALGGEQYKIDYRIILPGGEERIIYSHGGVTFDEKNKPIKMRGIVQDITERKKAEEALANIEIARKKEIHHRIKNNLQVISSLLDLQAEKFKNRGYIRDSEILNAFKVSQDRVTSIALIHEELHEGGGNNTLNFPQYLEKLAENLFQTYSLENSSTSLNIELEEDVFFDMDIAVPLGIIVNELVSNSLKYAFKGKNEKGIIQIKLYRQEPAGDAKRSFECEQQNPKYTPFILTVSDNGAGIPQSFDLENTGSLGIHLVRILVDQLGGELELKREHGTEFRIKFRVKEEI